MNLGNSEYPSLERYDQAVDILDKVTTMILFEFGKNAINTKDIIIRNFVARAIVSLKGH